MRPVEKGQCFEQLSMSEFRQHPTSTIFSLASIECDKVGLPVLISLQAPLEAGQTSALSIVVVFPVDQKPLCNLALDLLADLKTLSLL